MPDTSSPFLSALFPVLGSMMTLFLISLLGFGAVRLKIIGDAGVSSITRLLVDVIVPAKLVVALAAGLNADTLSQAGVVMLAMLALNLGGLGVGWTVTRLWPGGTAAQNRTIPILSSFQNGIYVPLPLVLAIVPPDQRDIATVLVGGAVTVMVLTQWSIGVFLLRGPAYQPKAGAGWRELVGGTINPPMVSILIGALLALVPVVGAAARGEAAPAFVAIPMEAAALLGSALAPVAMILLGMLIGQCNLRGALTARTVAITVTLKLILMPLVMLVALWTGFLGWVAPLVALVLIVEAASPPATNLSVIARRYDGDWELVSAVLLVTYLGALVTMPIFAAIIMTRDGFIL